MSAGTQTRRSTELDVRRVAALILTAIPAVYISLVAFTNWTDFGTNQDFVDHVFAMDTTFNDPDVMWRAIDNNTIVNIAYVGVIIAETIAALLLLYASWLWLRSVFKGTPVDQAQRWSTLGFLGIILIFGGGFITIGGEYFEMWQSSEWNGLQPALQNFTMAAFGLLYVTLAFRAPLGEAGVAPERNLTE